VQTVLIFILTMAGAMGLDLGRPFGSHMVLPMRREVPVWGSAQAGQEVEVTFHGSKRTTRAGSDGRWQLLLPAMEPSARPAKLTILAGKQRRVLDDVLVGRVWLCSGQSNMDFQLSRAIGGSAEAAGAGKSSSIRLFNLSGVATDARAYEAATLARLNPRDHFTGQWERASEEAASAFSAVAWWTAKLIQEREGVPLGLIENAVGGSGTEAWLPREVLESRADYRTLAGPRWMTSAKMSPWARGRAGQNLGSQLGANHPFKPGFLFEAGVRDFAGFPIDGVLWYQGETNAEINDTAWNQRLITDLVKGWRKVLGNERLPFFVVQLPRIGGNDPLRQYWPQYRRAQADAARALNNVTLVRTEDLGWDSPDVHPPDKLPVARRLAAAVMDSQKKQP